MTFLDNNIKQRKQLKTKEKVGLAGTPPMIYERSHFECLRFAEAKCLFFENGAPSRRNAHFRDINMSDDTEMCDVTSFPRQTFSERYKNV